MATPTMAKYGKVAGVAIRLHITVAQAKIISFFFLFVDVVVFAVFV